MVPKLENQLRRSYFPVMAVESSPPSVSLSDNRKWYREGLSFECTQCGNCCSGPPGYVWVTPKDVEDIARFIGKTDGKLGKEHIRRVAFRTSLVEKPGGDCVFLKREGGKALCSIYPVRPLQCRTWPFWDHNLKTKSAWDDASKNCPGMNRGKHYDFVAIEGIRLKRPD